MAHIGTLTSEVGIFTSEVGTLTSEVGKLTIEVGTLTSEVGTLTSEVGTLTSEVGTLTSEVGTLTSEVVIAILFVQYERHCIVSVSPARMNRDGAWLVDHEDVIVLMNYLDRIRCHGQLMSEIIQ